MKPLQSLWRWVRPRWAAGGKKKKKKKNDGLHVCSTANGRPRTQCINACDQKASRVLLLLLAEEEEGEAAS